jgi:hypothetical protein
VFSGFSCTGIDRWGTPVRRLTQAR